MTSPDDDFARDVRDALLHVHDIAHLLDHPLGDELALPQVSALDRARALRKALLEAIEHLRPADAVPYGEPEWRPYQVLLQRYVQHQPSLVICNDLGISDRQYQREHSRALQALTSILSVAHNPMGDGDGSLSEDDSMETEAQFLVSSQRRESLDLSQLLQGVVDSVRRLAADHDVRIQILPDAGSGSLHGDRSLVRQILFNILVDLLTVTPGRSLLVEPASVPGRISISFRFSDLVSSLPLESSSRLALARELAQAVGGTIQVAEGTINLHLPAASPVLLLVDDNDDLVRLLCRYLAGEDVEVASTASANEALRLARELSPALILLDVMMPSHDGWELLQTFKHHPDTQAIPVVICSILNEPELASSLGADGYLAKPVSQDSFLRLVRRYI